MGSTDAANIEDTPFTAVVTPKGAAPPVILKDNDDKKKSETEPLVPYTHLFRYADSTDKILMAIGILGGCITGIVQPLQIVIFGDVINAFQNDVSTPEGADIFSEAVNEVVLKFIYVSLVVLVSGFAQVGAWSVTSSRQIRRIRHAYIKAILRQEIGWFDENSPTEIATRVADTTATIQDGIGRKAGDGFQFASMAIGGIIIGLYYGWQLGLALLAFTPVIALTAFLMMKAIGDTVNAGAESYATAGGIAEESLSNIRTVQSFNAAGAMETRYNTALEKTEAAETHKGLAVGLGTGVMFGTIYFTYAFGMYYGAVLVADDQLPLDNPACSAGDDCYNGGRVLSVFFSVIMGAMALGQAGPSLQAVFSARAAAASVYAVIDRKSKCDHSEVVATDVETQKKTDLIDLNKDTVKGDIVFKDVNFHYPSRPDVEVCKSYCLEIPSGSTLALVGPSGSGKSTIVSLLERFYDPQSGSITLDGVPLTDLSVASLRRAIGLVGQEPALFATTIAENIRYGLPSATMDDVINAAKSANAFDFISKMPNGFDTNVGESGTQLSGGQKQRIAIARAILKDPAIMLLDEATSALDTESEGIVQASLDALLALKKRTTIVIAHRLSTIRHADQIAVVSDGKIIELGSHEKLMENKDGVYHQMVQTQESKGKADRNSLAIPNKTSAEGEAATTTEASSEREGTKSNLSIKKVEKDGKESNVELAEFDESFKDVPMSRIWALSKPDASYVIMGSIGAAINGATFPVWGVLLAKVTILFFRLDLGRDGLLEQASHWAIAFACLGVVFCAASVLQNYGFAIVASRITRRIRSDAFASMLSQEIGWHDVGLSSAGALTTGLATDSNLVQSMTAEWLNRVLVTVFTLGVAFSIAFYYSWKMTLILIAAFPFLALASMAEMEATTGQHNTVKNKNDDDDDPNTGSKAAGALLSESVLNMRTVCAFNLENERHERYYDLLHSSAIKERNSGLRSGLGFGLSQFTMIAIQALLFYIGGLLVADDQLTFDDMFMVLLAVMLSSFGVGMAASAVTDSAKAKAAAKRLFGIIDRVPANVRDEAKKGSNSITTLTGDIEFKNVKFSYPSRKTVSVCDGYSLTIPAGSTTALVGVSGGGKSTAIALLERFYDPDSGSVTLDGKDLTTLDLEWLRNNISLVSQEPILFSGTIADNIATGKPSATIEEIHEAAKMANAFDFINQFPEGFDTDVGDRGVQVSGGQKQRIAIARAMIRDPKVLLLDEATSALDSESERIVQASLDSLLLTKKRTTLVIAHRLSTIKDADQIAVIKGGKIVELGKHDDLLQLESGVYRALVQRQLSNST